MTCSISNVGINCYNRFEIIFIFLRSTSTNFYPKIIKYNTWNMMTIFKFIGETNHKWAKIDFKYRLHEKFKPDVRIFTASLNQYIENRIHLKFYEIKVSEKDRKSPLKIIYKVSNFPISFWKLIIKYRNILIVKSGLWIKCRIIIVRILNVN